MLLFVTAVSVVLVVSFVCSIFESVLLSVTRPQIEILVRSGRSAGKLLASYKDNMDVPIAAILILNTAAHTIGAAVAGASYANVFDTRTLWLFSVLFTIAVLLFTEIIPKTLGVSYARVLASPVAHGIRMLTVLLRPLVVLSEKISKSLRSDVEAPVTSPEEIRLLAFLGHSEGVVGKRTAGIITGATHLGQLRAHDVMLPRDLVCFLAGTMTRSEVLQLVQESGHSRFPYSPTGSLDDVNGVILVKQLLYWLHERDEEAIDWESLRIDALYIPENAPLPRMLRTFQESQRHMAIIVDEYGSITGIATLEDVLEEIVGDIDDELDEPTKDIVPLGDDAYQVSAAVDLRKLSAALGIEWEPEGDITTVGGLVTEILERIPSAGDFIDWRGYRITVLKAGRQKVKLLSVRKLQNA